MSELLGPADESKQNTEAARPPKEATSTSLEQPSMTVSHNAPPSSDPGLPASTYEAADTLTSLATASSILPPSDVKTEAIDPVASLPEVKTENMADSSGLPSEAPPAKDPGSSAAIDTLKTEQELGPTKSTVSTSDITSEAADQKFAPAKPKATSKKGVARKPAPKKRKVDNKAASPAPSVQSTSSVTKKSKTKPTGLNSKGTSARATPLLNSSPAPGPGSDNEDEDDVSDSGSDKVYCICRKKDDHSWMIACDGGCDDWYHGKCVNMKEQDEDLIDKYICPRCTAAGDQVTTWKPMCRRDGCRKPARLSKSQISKYCSDDCGVRFMQAMTRRTADATASPRKTKKRKIVHPVDAGEGSSDDEAAGSRGGALRVNQVTSLAFAVDKAAEFRNLGNQAVAANRQIADTEASTTDAALLAPEQARLAEISEEKTRLRDRMGLLKDREKFIATAKEQVNHYAEQENIKPRDVCGFDARLSWSEDQFARWRDNPDTATPLQPLANNEADNRTNGNTTNKTSAKDDEGMQYFCAKKRCDKHRQWQKITLQDVRYDESELADQMRKLDREEGSIKERAALRAVREKAASSTGAMNSEVEVIMA